MRAREDPAPGRVIAETFAPVEDIGRYRGSKSP
jgi:hypothetical protein